MARKLTDGEARQMAAARKSFRGGRPLKPKTCRRCGAPCASATQAAAHCMGRNVRAQASARPVAALPERSPESLRGKYPKWLYHRTGKSVLLTDPQAEADLGEGWGDRPVPQEAEKVKKPEKAETK